LYSGSHFSIRASAIHTTKSLPQLLSHHWVLSCLF